MTFRRIIFPLWCHPLMPQLLKERINKMENEVTLSCSASYLLYIVPFLTSLILTTLWVKSHYPHFSNNWGSVRLSNASISTQLLKKKKRLKFNSNMKTRLNLIYYSPPFSLAFPWLFASSLREIVEGIFQGHLKGHLATPNLEDRVACSRNYSVFHSPATMRQHQSQDFLYRDYL